jgi:hypothetical protein
MPAKLLAKKTNINTLSYILFGLKYILGITSRMYNKLMYTIADRSNKIPDKNAINKSLRLEFEKLS